MILFLPGFLCLFSKGKKVRNEFAKTSATVFGEKPLKNKETMNELIISMFTLEEEEKYFMTMVK